MREKQAIAAVNECAGQRLRSITDGVSQRGGGNVPNSRGHNNCEIRRSFLLPPACSSAKRELERALGISPRRDRGFVLYLFVLFFCVPAAALNFQVRVTYSSNSFRVPPPVHPRKQVRPAGAVRGDGVAGAGAAVVHEHGHPGGHPRLRVRQGEHGGCVRGGPQGRAEGPGKP